MARATNQGFRVWLMIGMSLLLWPLNGLLHYHHSLRLITHRVPRTPAVEVSSTLRSVRQGDEGYPSPASPLSSLLSQIERLHST